MGIKNFAIFYGEKKESFVSQLKKEFENVDFTDKFPSEMFEPMELIDDYSFLPQRILEKHLLAKRYYFQIKVENKEIKIYWYSQKYSEESQKGNEEWTNPDIWGPWIKKKSLLYCVDFIKDQVNG